MKDIIVDNHMLFFAFRYALGRKSSAPGIVMTNLVKNLPQLSEVDLKRYIVEIDECEDFGMEMDKKNWLSLKEEIKKELEFRKTLTPKIEI